MDQATAVNLAIGMRVCAKQTLANSLFNERERFLGLSRFGFSNFGTKLYGRQLILLSFNTGLGLFQRSARMLQLTFGGDDEFTLCPLGASARISASRNLSKALVQSDWARASVSRACFAIPRKTSAA